MIKEVTNDDIVEDHSSVIISVGGGIVWSSLVGIVVVPSLCEKVVGPSVCKETVVSSLVIVGREEAGSLVGEKIIVVWLGVDWVVDASSCVVGSSVFVDSSIPGVVVGSECVVDERVIEKGVVVGAVVRSSDVPGGKVIVGFPGSKVVSGSSDRSIKNTEWATVFAFKCVKLHLI